jgi:hypothetical protein
MSANKIIRIKKLEVPNWQAKVTPAIERIAELLIKLDGQSSRPPVLKSDGNEVYVLTNENDTILIAAKVAETKGLRKLSVLIEENLTDDWLEMENLLNPAAKVTKTATKSTPKPVVPKKVTKKATPETFEELHFD